MRVFCTWGSVQSSLSAIGLAPTGMIDLASLITQLCQCEFPKRRIHPKRYDLPVASSSDPLALTGPSTPMLRAAFRCRYSARGQAPVSTRGGLGRASSSGTSASVGSATRCQVWGFAKAQEGSSSQGAGRNPFLGRAPKARKSEGPKSGAKSRSEVGGRRAEVKCPPQPPPLCPRPCRNLVPPCPQKTRPRTNSY